MLLTSSDSNSQDQEHSNSASSVPTLPDAPVQETSPSPCQEFSSVELPPWLNSCLIYQQDDSDVGGGDSEDGDSSTNARAKADNHLICDAFRLAYEFHGDQRRKSGEPYVAHPIAVAGLLRDLGGSPATIAAGFLHDIVEDTELTGDDLEARFGPEVRFLVEGVTKLSKIEFSSKTEHQAENFRRMFLAMAQDIRVIIVKLADRLHNMRTLGSLRPEKQRRIALETREIFSPLANRLGIGRFKWELEDLCFQYLEPEAYREIADLVAEKRVDREANLDRVTNRINMRLGELGIHKAEISGRPKHLYGIYQKMQRKNKSFWEIHDIAAVRVIVNAVDECYRALAVVHDEFRPIPDRFKDYIGLPKPNRYQSLHTSVIGLNGRPLEIQIRTRDMHRVAEYGIAAHWKYKESGSSNLSVKTDDEKFTWLRQLLEWQSDIKDAQQYLDDVKTGLFDEDVYVFTPKGDVQALNQGATPVDFAYRIHTEVGNHCAGAIVNGRIVTLDRKLQNGDMVEIITQKNAHPSLDWLNFVVTPSSKNRIRQWYKRSHRDENIARGRSMLEREVGKNGFDSLLKSAAMETAARRSNYQTVDDLLAGLGYGEITINGVVNRIREAVRAAEPPEEATHEAPVARQITPVPLKTHQSPIVGVEDLMHYIAGCCRPIPGESILGIVTRSRGIAIHRQGCENAESMAVERRIPVQWNTQPLEDGRRATYPIDIKVDVIDRVGILKDVLSRLADDHINVHRTEVSPHADGTATLTLGVDIYHSKQISQMFSHIRKLGDVLNIHRISDGRAAS
ncbi:MAG: bifunctional (p)ppGpp synthetase/guanosine-3',5'-bis(diphosphate) 3'-pyrophosphohydrolase [Cyanobacteria bacterium P01_C01_bin.89]